MDSVDDPLVSRLVCPTIRRKDFIVDNSYFYSDAEDGESSRRHHLLPLIGCNNQETGVKITNETEKVICGACYRDTIGTTYYMCNECDKCYHKECVESPPLFKSPNHRKHVFKLQNYDNYLVDCNSCTTAGKGLLYRCSICDINLCPVCVRKPPIINHQKRHEHTLYFFPRKTSLECNVCGLQNDKYLIFVCIQCDFFVHERCIYIPDVIKISRHKRRLTFAYSLQSGEWSCKICSGKINENYGTYSCMKKGCIYVAHVECATKRSTWDGKELEGKPEEDDIIKPPFEEVDGETILHFSHLEHPIRLEKDIKKLYDEYKYCQACMLPLYDGKAYKCMHRECDFVLHEACARLPRVKQHALHAHSLTLEPCLVQKNNPCDRCYRDCCGFKYVCYKHNGCKDFSLDVRCASISEMSYHDSHNHPLLMFRYAGKVTCSICYQYALSALHCSKCNFFLCFYCATLPYKMRYKNDEHLLTISYQNDPNGIYHWCDLCEKTMNPRYGVYRCNECQVTLHTECALGTDLYMNPSSRITLRGKEFKIVENNALTRPICIGCQRRCQYRTMFIAASGDIYCSIRDICKDGYTRRYSLVNRLLNNVDFRIN